MSAGWWVAVVALWPASSRPYIGSTQDNSIISLITGYNGLSRLFGGDGPGGGRGPGGGGGGGGAGFGGSSGIGRLFNTAIGGQVSWLLPFAGAGLVAGLALTIRRSRTDRERAGWLLWGGWALTCAAVFSLSSGVFHPYYTVQLAPAVAALVGAGGVTLWKLGRLHRPLQFALPVAVLATAAWATVLLARASGYQDWLTPAIIVGAVLAAAGLWIGSQLRHKLLVTVAAVVAALTLLAGPAAYSITTVGNSAGGSLAAAGPSSASGFGSGRGSGGALRGGPGDPSTTSASGLVAYLEAHQGSAKYLVAAFGSQSSASIIIESGKPVITIGGFNGGDPAPTLAQFEDLVATGQVKYVLVSGAGGGPGAARAASARVEAARGRRSAAGSPPTARPWRPAPTAARPTGPSTRCPPPADRRRRNTHPSHHRQQGRNPTMEDEPTPDQPDGPQPGLPDSAAWPMATGPNPEPGSGAGSPPPPAEAPPPTASPPPGSGPAPADPFWMDTPAEGASVPYTGNQSAGRSKPSRRPLKTWLAAGAGAAVLVIGGAVGIGAASSSNAGNSPAAGVQGNGPGGFGGAGQGLPGGGGTAGTIAKVTGSSFTLESGSGDATTVTTSSDTTVTSSSSGSIGDIATGDHVTILGAASGSDVTAERIIDSGSVELPTGPGGRGGAARAAGGGQPPAGAGQGQGGPPGGAGFEPVTGQVTKVSGSTITVRSSSATYSVTASSATKVSLVKKISVDDLKAGDTVQVSGTTSGSTIAATHIRVGDLADGPGSAGGGPGGPGGAGGPGSGTTGGQGNVPGGGTSGSTGSSSPTTI